MLQAVVAWLVADAGGPEPGKFGLSRLGRGPAQGKAKEQKRKVNAIQRADWAPPKAAAQNQCNASHVVLLKVAGLVWSIRYTGSVRRTDLSLRLHYLLPLS